MGVPRPWVLLPCAEWLPPGWGWGLPWALDPSGVAPFCMSAAVALQCSAVLCLGMSLVWVLSVHPACIKGSWLGWVSMLPTQKTVHILMLPSFAGTPTRPEGSGGVGRPTEGMTPRWAQQ